MRTSQSGIEFIKRWEGLRLVAYEDGAGVMTIGYGSTRGVKKGDVITEKEAEMLLRNDLVQPEEAVNDLVDIDLEQHEFDALVSFTFNCGAHALRTSTLRTLLNSGDRHGAALQFLRWDKAKDRKTGEVKVLNGLTRRRIAEKAMFLGEEL